MGNLLTNPTDRANDMSIPDDKLTGDECVIRAKNLICHQFDLDLNLPRAENILKSAVDRWDHPECAFQLGELCRQGHEHSCLTKEQSEMYYKKAMIRGHRNANRQYANEILQNSSSSTSKIEEAISILQNLSNKGDGQAMVHLGEIFEDGLYGKRKDMSKAMDLYREAIATNHRKAHWHLGMIYRQVAEGVDEDHTKAKSIFRKGS